LETYEMRQRTVYVVDAFGAGGAGGAGRASEPPAEPGESAEGSDQPADPEREVLEVTGGGRGLPDLVPDLNDVREGFSRFDVLDRRVRFLQGEPAASLPGSPIEKVALLRLGKGIGDRAEVVLEELYDKITLGGVIIVEDYDDPACQKA